MRLIKLMILAGFIGFAWNYWKKAEKSSLEAEEEVHVTSTTRSSRGFVAISGINDAHGNRVLVVAPQRCSSYEAQLADSLVEGLRREGIPVTHTNSISFSGSDNETLERAEALMSQSPPLVFISGRVKSQPSLSEVIQEYRSR